MSRNTGQATKQSAQKQAPASSLSNTHQRILEVAEDVFSRYGYLAARIDDIAQQVGIRRPSLFHHFRNKEALYQAVLDRWIDHQAAYFAQALRDSETQDPVTELEVLVDATFDFLVDNPSYAYLALHTIACNQVKEVPTEVSTVSMDHWASLLDRGRTAEQFTEATVAECMALIGGMVSFYVAMPDSRTGLLSAIGEVERERLRTELQRLVKTLVLTD